MSSPSPNRRGISEGIASRICALIHREPEVTQQDSSSTKSRCFPSIKDRCSKLFSLSTRRPSSPTTVIPSRTIHDRYRNAVSQADSSSNTNSESENISSAPSDQEEPASSCSSPSSSIRLNAPGMASGAQEPATSYHSLLTGIPKISTEAGNRRKYLSAPCMGSTNTQAGPGPQSIFDSAQTIIDSIEHERILAPAGQGSHALEPSNAPVQRRGSFPSISTRSSLALQLSIDAERIERLDGGLYASAAKICKLQNNLNAAEIEKTSLSKRISALEYENRQLRSQHREADRAASKWYDRYTGARDKFLDSRGTIEQCVTKLVEQQKTINALQTDLPLKVVDQDSTIQRLRTEVSHLSDGFRVAKEDGNVWKELFEEEKSAREDLRRDLRSLKRHRHVDRAIIAALKLYRSSFFNDMPKRLAELVEELYCVGNSISQQKETEAKLRAQIAEMELGLQGHGTTEPLGTLSEEV